MCRSGSIVVDFEAMTSRTVDQSRVFGIEALSADHDNGFAFTGIAFCIPLDGLSPGEIHTGHLGPELVEYEQLQLGNDFPRYVAQSNLTSEARELVGSALRHDGGA